MSPVDARYQLAQHGIVLRGHLCAIPALFGVLSCPRDKLRTRRARDFEGGAFGALGHARTPVRQRVESENPFPLE